MTVDADDRLTELESLQEWLAESAELRGRVTPVESPPPAWALGPVLDSILVALAPGSVAAALATALVTWIRHRSGGVRVEIELPDGTRARLEADKVRTLTDAQLRGELDVVVAALQASSASPVRAAVGSEDTASGGRAVEPPAGPVALPAASREATARPRTDG